MSVMCHAYSNQDENFRLEVINAINSSNEAMFFLIKDLKKNDDGKIIDHIYDYQSLIDTSNIFYIGDSKYYKSNSEVGNLSKYKQFTYAKNVIQFNIDLLNKDKKETYKPKIRYRDQLTEGYNITPNFFIYGLGVMALLIIICQTFFRKIEKLDFKILCIRPSIILPGFEVVEWVIILPISRLLQSRQAPR